MHLDSGDSRRKGIWSGLGEGESEGGAEMEYSDVLNRALDEGCEDVDDSFGLEWEVERTRGLLDSSFYYLAISVSFYVLVFGVSCD